MPSTRTSQHRPANGSGNVIPIGKQPLVDVPRHGFHSPIKFRPDPVIPRDKHPLRLKEWQQLEDNHIRFAQAHGLKTVGTSYLTGEPWRYYQAELGIDSKGQTMLYRPDVIMHTGWDHDRWILLEDKWQKKGGSCEAKVFEVWWNLHHARTYDPRVVAAYLVLDGPGWSEKNTERFKLMLSTMPATVRVFFSDADFLAHGIPEAWNDPARDKAWANPGPYAFTGTPQPQLRLA